MARAAAVVLAAPLVAVLGGEAAATVPDMLGLGADHAAMAGGVTAVADDGYAAYYNPAGLTQGSGVRLSLSYVLGQASLEPFSGIVYDRDGDGSLRGSDGTPEYGPVGADYRQRPEGQAQPFYTSGVQFGAAIPLGRYLGIGVAGYFPKEGAARVQLEDPQLPYYVMFRNRNNRLTFNPAVAIKPLHDVHIGVGAQVMAATEASVRLTLRTEVDAFTREQQAAPGSGAEEQAPPEVTAHISSQVEHLSARMVYRATPNVGLLIGLGAFVDETSALHRLLGRFALGAAYRGPYGVPTDADLVVGASGHLRFADETVLLSPLSQEPVELSLSEPLAAFNPAQLALGLRAGYGPIDVVADYAWTDWSAFKEMTLPYQRIDVQSLAATELIIETGRPLPRSQFEDTWSLRIGARCQLGPWGLGKLLRWGRVTVRGGFALIPSPVPDQIGLTNFMDSDRRVLSAGVGLELGRLPGFTDSPFRIDAAVQSHQLVRRTVSKRSGLLSDEDGDGLLDYPHGYPLAGQITSAGRMWAATVGVTVFFAGV